jgi:hypothetical protein
MKVVKESISKPFDFDPYQPHAVATTTPRVLHHSMPGV